MATEAKPRDKHDGVLDEFMPKGDEEYLIGAWIGCLSWALGEPKVVDAFRADTGINYSPPRSGIDRMIDEATGADKAFIMAFLKWFNANVWGDLPAPADPIAKEQS